MPDPAQRAKELFESGLNCSQAVVCAFSDVTGLDPKLAQRLASPLGGGMGRMREVCGAVSGMFLVLGLLEGTDEASASADKAALYEKVRALAGAFREQNGSIVCRELLGLDRRETGGEPCARTADYYKKRPCALLCADAARILDEYLQKKE